MDSVSQWLWINMEPSVLHKFALVWDKFGLVLNKKCSAPMCWADSRWRSWKSHIHWIQESMDVVLVIIMPFSLGKLELAGAYFGEMKKSSN